MARRLVLMPVPPRVTVSVAENFDNGGWEARAERIFFDVSFFAVNQVAPKAVLERMRNSRRCIENLRCGLGCRASALGFYQATSVQGTACAKILAAGNGKALPHRSREAQRITRIVCGRRQIVAASPRLPFSIPRLRFRDGPGGRCPLPERAREAVRPVEHRRRIAAGSAIPWCRAGAAGWRRAEAGAGRGDRA